jgi:ferredoxin-NADP reductase
MKGGRLMRIETTVLDILRHTHSVKSFRFPRPESFAYKAGQFMFVTIYDGKETLRKHFTISSSPTEDFLEFTKKLTESKFSSALKKLKVSDWAEIEGPYGKFTFEGEFEKIAMLSGGIGITPLRSICKYCTDMQLSAKITLLYACRSQEDIVFREELEKMQEQNETLNVIFTVDEASKGWTGQTGRIDVRMIKREIPDYRERVFYICGPPAMVRSMEALLEDLGVTRDHIKKENFTGY